MCFCHKEAEHLVHLRFHEAISNFILLFQSQINNYTISYKYLLINLLLCSLKGTKTAKNTGSIMCAVNSSLPLRAEGDTCLFRYWKFISFAWSAADASRARDRRWERSPYATGRLSRSDASLQQHSLAKFLICIYQTPEGGHISLNSIYKISEIAWNIAPWLSGALFSHIHIFLSYPRADALIFFWLQQRALQKALLSNVSDTPFIAFSCYSQWVSDTANNVRLLLVRPN